MPDFIAATRSTGGPGPKVQFSCEGHLPAAVDAAVRDEPYFCRAGINIASVLCDGAIGACPNTPRSLVQGNIRVDDFVEVWNRRYQKLRRRARMRTGQRDGCDQWSRCQGNSLHLWDDEAGRTSCCTFERAVG